ncbi:MAG TPA: membrane protein insertion efficiency factor YidD [Actinomycetota bacterium]
MSAHELTWRAGTPARTLLIASIRLYRAVFSGWLGGQCRFYPTCSRYAEDAIRHHGALRGSALAVWRVGRCNPYGRGGLDPVPPSRHGSGRYDDILQVNEEARA